MEFLIVTAHRCPECGSKVLAQWRGKLAALLNLKKTNIVVCSSELCDWYYDMNIWKSEVLIP